MNDGELYEAFRAVAKQDARAALPFSRAQVEAQRPHARARSRRRAWFAASGITLAAAATLLFFVVPQREMLDLDLGGPVWVPSTDFLLNTPGRSVAGTVPPGDVTTTSSGSSARPLRGDTSGRDR
jgi:hypothetical protein